MQNFFNSISILFTFTVAATSSYATSIAAIGIGYVLANVLGSFVDSLARNPSLAKQFFSYAILGFALTEGFGLVALGMMPFFFFGGGEISPSLLLLQKVGVILGGQALSGGLLKVGCPWGLSIFIITLLKSWTWWPNLTCFIIEQDLNAPPGPEVVYLFSDEERREAIRQRFSFLTMSTREISPRSLEELLIMERAMEKRLLELGASPHRIVSKWGEIRGIAFPSINGNPLSDQTIHKTYKIFCEVGIDQSPPFLKIEKKCQASRLFLTDF